MVFMKMLSPIQPDPVMQSDRRHRRSLDPRVIHRHHHPSARRAIYFIL